MMMPPHKHDVLCAHLILLHVSRQFTFEHPTIDRLSTGAITYMGEPKGHMQYLHCVIQSICVLTSAEVSSLHNESLHNPVYRSALVVQWLEGGLSFSFLTCK